MATRAIKTTAQAPNWTNLTELASTKVGGKVVFATDEWFAAASNIINYEDPVWKEGEFTANGKWMDGWESRRKRIPGHDWCIIKLGIQGTIKGVVVDTAYFSGNFVPKISIQAACDPSEAFSGLSEYKSTMGAKATEEQLLQVQKKTCGLTGAAPDQWTEILPMKELGAGYQDSRFQYFRVNTDQRWTHIRLNMFPDGGIARVRVHGSVTAPSIVINEQVDLVSAENGGLAIGWSDSHYGHPRQLINPGRGVNMGDGWETARRMDRPPVLECDETGNLTQKGNEWAVMQLGMPGEVSSVVIDTAHFKGNFPESVKIEACEANIAGQPTFGLDKDECDLLGNWTELLPRTKLGPDQVHRFDVASKANAHITHVRVTIFPDGGISRVRLFGKPTAQVGASKL